MDKRLPAEIRDLSSDQYIIGKPFVVDIKGMGNLSKGAFSIAIVSRRQSKWSPSFIFG